MQIEESVRLMQERLTADFDIPGIECQRVPGLLMAPSAVLAESQSLSLFILNKGMERNGIGRTTKTVEWTRILNQEG